MVWTEYNLKMNRVQPVNVDKPNETVGLNRVQPVNVNKPRDNEWTGPSTTPKCASTTWKCE